MSVDLTFSFELKLETNFSSRLTTTKKSAEKASRILIGENFETFLGKQQKLRINFRISN